MFRTVMTSSKLIFDLYRDIVDLAIERALSERDGLLYQMMRYQLGWVDQHGQTLDPSPHDRPLSTLCLMSCQGMGGDHDMAVPAAAALELIHTFTVVHGDVQDGVPPKDGSPSVWWIWGPGQAINVGDGLHALGRSEIFRLSDSGFPMEVILSALNALDQACLRVCEGQYMELTFQEKLDVTVGSYLKMAEAKSGSLLGCAAELGSLLASGDRKSASLMALAGTKLGVMAEIQKDIQGIWPSKSAGPTSIGMANKKKSFPVVKLLEEGSISLKRRIGTLYFKRVLESDDLDALRDLLDEGKAKESAQAVAQIYLGDAMKAVKETGMSSWGIERFEELGQELIRVKS